MLYMLVHATVTRIRLRGDSREETIARASVRSDEQEAEVAAQQADARRQAALAAQEPVCEVIETAVLPALVHPERLPVSKPPLVMPDGGGGGAAPMLASS